MEIVDRRVPLSRIGKTVGPAPVARFIDNVRRHGVVVPVLLRELVSEDGILQLVIIDGNRRVAASRKLGLHDVPARVLMDVSDDDAARLTLTGNNFRSSNDITEFWAIKHLERSGHSPRRIADDAGINQQYLDSRNRWSTLDRRIFVGFAEGKIAATVANKISRLAPDEQRELGDLFAQQGRVLTVDVERVTKPRKRPRPTSPNDWPSLPHDQLIPIRDQGYPGTRPDAAPVVQPAGERQDDNGSLDDARSSQHPISPTCHGSEQRRTPETDTVEPPVAIISVPVERGSRTVSPPTTPDVMMVSAELRQSIATVVNMAIAEGISPGYLADAVAQSYREAMAGCGEGESFRGRDQQS
jgi:hypothetical protein